MGQVPSTTPAPSMPSGVALTTSSQSRASAATPTRPPAPARPAATVPRDAVRLTTTTSPAPASARARITARAAPPAPTTRQRRPAGSNRSPRRRAATRPGPSVLSPSPRRVEDHAVYRPQPFGPGRSSVDQPGRVVLVGHGHREPPHPQAAAPRPGPRPPFRPPPGSPPRPSPGPCRRRPVVQPRESEWATGSPMTPTTAVAAERAIRAARAAWPGLRWPPARRVCRRRPRCRRT